jgi:hypothetical protein
MLQRFRRIADRVSSAAVGSGQGGMDFRAIRFKGDRLPKVFEGTPVLMQFVADESAFEMAQNGIRNPLQPLAELGFRVVKSKASARALASRKCSKANPARNSALEATRYPREASWIESLPDSNAERIRPSGLHANPLA